jgi:hypothetical protein
MPATPPDGDKSVGMLRWTISIGLIAVGAVLVYATEIHNWRLAQIASMAGVTLIVSGVAFLSATLTQALIQLERDPLEGDPEGTDRQREKNRSKWLTRLVLVAAFGMAVIVLYAVQYNNWTLARVASTLSVGFITAGAAWLTGALAGFLFGIPHRREGDRTNSGKESPPAGQPAIETSAATDQDDRYQPSTSLEQISDWLTKIIVGVGLTQLDKIPAKLDGLASYIASGLGGGSANTAFSMGIIVHFSVCGFLFGFLWARLYLLEAFRAADLLKRVEKISSQMLDLRAKDFVANQLDSARPEVPESVLKEAIRKASQSARDEILEKAKDAREEAGSRETTASRVIPIFRALTDSDTANLFHRGHGQLGYALQDLGKWEESENALTKAIQIRERLRRSGWNYYELKRALARIQLDTESPSKPETRDLILADLRKAYPEHSDKITKNKDIQAWLKKNSLSAGDLGLQEQREG